MNIEILAEQNPWWRDPSALSADRYLRALGEARHAFIHPVEEELGLECHGIQVLRGPRQIGKTTLLKKTVRSLLERGVLPRNVLFLAVDVAGIGKDRELMRALRIFCDWRRAGGSTSRLFLLLDEVTYCEQWATGIKSASDLGLLDNALVIATGSQAVELKRGGERLPGRRGELESKSDLVMLPLSFGEVVRGLQPEIEIPRSCPADVGAIYSHAQELAIHGAALEQLLNLYRVAGGFPFALNRFEQNGVLDPEVHARCMSAVLGDLARIGRREPVFRELMHVVFSKEFEPVDWQNLAQSCSIGSHNTVHEYIDDACGMFLLVVLWQVRSLGDSILSFRKRRKIYPLDPLFHHVLRTWSRGDYDPADSTTRYVTEPRTAGKVIESLIATHMARRFSKVAFWRNNSEIDVIGFTTDQQPLYVEVKYQAKITSSDKKSLKKIGGGLLVTRQDLSYDDHNQIAMIPAHLALPILANGNR